jgi:diacylglycerol kinase
MIRYFFKSIVFAVNGIFSFFRTERNGQLQGIAGIIAIVAAVYFKISKTEWLFILGCTGAVISLEMINSSIERICNIYTRDFHPDIKFIKDVSAAAVLWASIVSAIIGLTIFLPYIVLALRK